MPRFARFVLLATGLGALTSAASAPAQRAPRPARPASDTTVVPPRTRPSTPPDSARPSGADDDHESDAGRRLTAGLAAGSLAYYGGRTEQGLSASVRLALRSWVALRVTPTALTSHEPGALGATRRFSGLADLPVALELGRALPLPGAPRLGATYTMIVPVGDTASGFGGGRFGASLGADAALSPLPHLSVSVGAGRSLAGLSPRTAFDATAATWGDAGVSVELGRGLELSTGYGRDLGQVDSTFGRSQTVSGGVSVRVPRVQALTLAAAHALSGAGPRWSVSVGVGAALSELGSVARGHTPLQAVASATGAGPHGLPSATWPGHAGNAPGHGGTKSGPDSTSSGRGRGHHP